MKTNKRNIYCAFIIFFGAFIPLLVFPYFLEKIRLDIYLEENNVFEDVYIISEQGEENIKLVYSELSQDWYAFIPSHIANSDIQFLHKNNMLSIANEAGEINPKIALREIENGETFALSVKRGNTVISSANIIIYQADYLPTMYINTSSGSLEYIHNSKNNKEQANFTIYTSNGEVDSYGECVLKGRGNSSWAGGMDGTGQKKPYNIKLASADSLLGMDFETKWTLLACYDDQAFIRNKIAFELARKLGCKYTPQAEFINLYANGEYKGLYLLTQRIAVDGGFINIHDLDQANNEINTAREYEIYDNIENGLEEHAVVLNNNPDNITGGYLLEFDARTPNVSGWFTTARNSIVIKSPESASIEQVTYIADYMRETENLLFDDHSDKKYLDYIDIDSWAKMYVLQDFLLNWDVSYSSFYVYKEINDSHLYAGPVWDFDLSIGNLHLGEYMDFTKQVQWIEGNKNNLWLNALMNKPEFADKVQNIYQNDFWILLDELTEKDIPLWIEYLAQSAHMDALVWGKENYNFTEKTSNVLNWIHDRKQFLIDYNANPENYYKVTFEMDSDKSFIYCNLKNEKLEYIPYFEGYAWVDENGNSIDSETLISPNAVLRLSKSTTP